MSEKSKNTTHAGVLGDMARSPGEVGHPHVQRLRLARLITRMCPMRLCRKRGPLDEAGSLSLRCSRFHVDTPTFQYSRIGDDGSRSDRGGPLERTAARSIPKPCLEAGHRIVPTCQPVHVGSDRTDRSSVLFLDSIPSDGRFLAGGFNPGGSAGLLPTRLRERRSPGVKAIGHVGALAQLPALASRAASVVQ